MTHLIYILLLSTIFVISGCSGNKQDVTQPAKDTFASLYPEAKHTKWSQRDGYEVVTFNYKRKNREAWFDKNGWVMTISDQQYTHLPKKVKHKFSQSDYAEWEQLGVKRVERVNQNPVWIIDVERNKVRYALYYTQTGILLRTVNATGQERTSEDFLPTELPNEIAQSLYDIYPTAIVYEVACEDSTYAIDVIDEEIGKKIVISESGWQSSSFDIPQKDLPQAVSRTLSKNYRNCTIGNIRLKEMPQEKTYTVELHNDTLVYSVCISNDGHIIQDN